MNDKINIQSLKEYEEELHKIIEEKQREKEKLQNKLKIMEVEFRKGKWLIHSLQETKRKIVSFVRAVPAYLLGRRNPKQLYSKAYRQKDASNKLKKYKSYLYNQGFEEKALADLQSLFHNLTNRSIRKAAAWELGLWYANKLNQATAELALYYLEETLATEKREDTLRRGAILQGESYGLLGHMEKGKKVIKDALMTQEHPDLYLALANLKEDVSERIGVINQALAMYGLAPITLNKDREQSLYGSLTVEEPLELVKEGPKVTVIIPVYNGEEGINIAIESLQKQTYKNLEILVVDDCSKDNTVEIVKRYTEIDPCVKLLSTPINSGPYVARNIGLQAAQGEFITINDADDWSHPEKIARQVKDLIENPNHIANTSEHARVTAELKLYRRGLPGQYIFSNMSSLMFRKKLVVEKVGYWDSVRFAGDSEFVKRLVKTFGKKQIAYLKTGPLSLPMQSLGSLTGSSAFGYNGYLKGVRKEYAESQAYFHKNTSDLYLDFPQGKRPFPVPEPMWPRREINKGEKRKFEVTIIADFRKELNEDLAHFILQMKEKSQKIGLIQMGYYDLNISAKIHSSIRSMMDGGNVQMLVYGEKIHCDILVVASPGLFQEQQKYVPNVVARTIHVILAQTPNDEKVKYNLRSCARNIEAYGKARSTWYPINDKVRKHMKKNNLKELNSIRLSKENWLKVKEEKAVEEYIENWLMK